MSKPWIHAQLDAKQLGGIPEDYLKIHEFMDSSKGAIPGHMHRMLTHHSFFISTVIPRVFGETFKRESDGKVMSSRDIAERHVLQDFHGFIPSAQDYAQFLIVQPWMENGKGTPPSLSHQKQNKTKKVLNYD